MVCFGQAACLLVCYRTLASKSFAHGDLDVRARRGAIEFTQAVYCLASSSTACLKSGRTRPLHTPLHCRVLAPSPIQPPSGTTYAPPHERTPARHAGSHMRFLPPTPPPRHKPVEDMASVIASLDCKTPKVIARHRRRPERLLATPASSREGRTRFGYLPRSTRTTARGPSHG